LYTNTLAGQEAAAIATLPNFTTEEPTRQKTKPPGTADVIPTTENAPETSTNNAPATDTTNAPSTPDNTPAETAAAPVRIDAPNAPENFPNNQGKNSPEKPEGICECSGLVRDESGRSTVLEENTKKNENIVKVEHFPVKSQLTPVGTEHSTNLFEKHYRAELLRNPALDAFVEAIQDNKTVTLLTATKDFSRTHVSVIVGILKKKLSKRLLRS